MSANTGLAARATKLRPTTVSRIAVGVDGYPEGTDAVALAAAIARVTRAELMLVAVHPEPLVVLPEEMNWKSLENQSATTLAEVRRSFVPAARTVVETDLSVPRALERVVRREHRDLLIVGSSRQGPDGRVRIGKRTRQLLGHFNCALAIAARGAHQRPEPKLSRIGVGYDGGPESEAALALAGSIALAAGAELHLCGVVDDRVPPIGWSALARGAAGLWWEEVIVGEVSSLRELALSRATAIGPSAQVNVLRGRPADALLKLSVEMDLLVIGSRRWGPMARLLFGSTGEALGHDAGCPLLVVPRPAS